MKRSLALLTAVVLALALAACGDDTGDDSGAADDAPEAERGGDAAPPCDLDLDDGFRAWADAGFSGSVAVATGGSFDCVAAYGWADEADGTPNTVDTVFAIGSVSKSFTAATVLALVDEGAVALDDRAGDLVPGLEGPAADVTVEQLLLHTGGLTGSHGHDHEPLDRDEVVVALGRLERAFEPGSDYLYSNGGYTLLALIVEEVTGEDYRDHLVSRILPLPDGQIAGGFWDGEPAAPGPRAVGHLEDGPTEQMGDFEGPHWALTGNGDLAMTPADLATWTDALFTGQVGSSDVAEAAAGVGFDHGDGIGETPGWVVIGPERFGEPMLASSGGGGDVGHEVVVVWLPERERVIVVASNTPAVTAEDLLDVVGPALAAGEPLPLPAGTDVGGDPAEVEAVAGTYELATGGSYIVTVADGRPVIAARGRDAVEALFPLPDTVSVDDAARHEQQVLALLEGETREGQEELDALEDDFGPVDEVVLVGTVVQGGELRTYVALGAEDEDVLLWYALDERGGIAAVDGPTDPPALGLVADGDGGFRPDDPTGRGPDVTVTFDGDRLTITGPSGTTEARTAGG